MKFYLHKKEKTLLRTGFNFEKEKNPIKCLTSVNFVVKVKVPIESA